MNLNITKDRHDNEEHRGELFPGAKDRRYSYQDESMRFEFRIEGENPRRGDGVLNHDAPEETHRHYELTIERHTGKALVFRLTAERADNVEQRMQNGYAVTHDVLVTALSLGELCNRIFGPGAQVFHEQEHYPQAVKDVMRTCYR